MNSLVMGVQGNLYERLGVKENATQGEIRKAFQVKAPTAIKCYVSAVSGVK